MGQVLMLILFDLIVLWFNEDDDDDQWNRQNQHKWELINYILFPKRVNRDRFNLAK